VPYARWVPVSERPHPADDPQTPALRVLPVRSTHRVQVSGSVAVVIRRILHWRTRATLRISDPSGIFKDAIVTIMATLVQHSG